MVDFLEGITMLFGIYFAKNKNVLRKFSYLHRVHRQRFLFMKKE